MGNLLDKLNYTNDTKAAIKKAIEDKGITLEENATFRDFAAAIDSIKVGGAPPAEAFVLTGDCSYRFAYGGWDWFINQYSNQITTKAITNMNQMFYYCNMLEEIPFDINGHSNIQQSMSRMFNNCEALKFIPKISGTPSSTDYMFASCYRLKEIPEDIESWFDWSYIDSKGTSRGNMFASCYSLRSIPMGFLAHGNPSTQYYYSMYSSLFSHCNVLDEIIGLPIPFTSTWTSNGFNGAFGYCSRLKNLTFKMPEGVPYTVNWKNQTIDLTICVGYSNNTRDITDYNSGLTTATQITDDATYQALKDNPDSWTIDINYSRYNHDSAVATINSLPDASAYLATAGGTNTIKFKGASGALTDGGAINTLTEEEIAVATSRGWTVSFV